jgi:acyl carrier protein
VRWRNDGTIDFLGRIDRQVKITGVRIELGEVEAALESTLGVTQSVATALMDPSGQKRLVGYVTPATVEPAAVRAHCRTLLVPAMIPTVIVALESFPLLPGGKIDVRSLPAPDWSAPTGALAAASGSFKVDKDDASVISIILEVIGLDPATKVPQNTDIFDLGASSLHVSLIVSRMRRELGVNLDMREVYGNPLVKTLCDALRQQNGTSGGKLIYLLILRTYLIVSASDDPLFFLSSSAGSTGKQPKTKNRVLGYPLPVWYSAPIQQGIQRIFSNIAQLVTGFLVLLLVMGSTAPG